MKNNRRQEITLTGSDEAQTSLLTAKQVAALMQISTRSVWRLLSSGELIEPKSFDLTAKPATVAVEASCSKYREKNHLLLHDDLVSGYSLTEMRRPKRTVFPDSCKASHMVNLMVEWDLERVGIPYRDDQDLVADFTQLVGTRTLLSCYAIVRPMPRRNSWHDFQMFA